VRFVAYHKKSVLNIFFVSYVSFVHKCGEATVAVTAMQRRSLLRGGQLTYANGVAFFGETRHKLCGGLPRRTVLASACGDYAAGAGHAWSSSLCSYMEKGGRFQDCAPTFTSNTRQLPAGPVTASVKSYRLPETTCTEPLITLVLTPAVAFSISFPANCAA